VHLESFSHKIGCFNSKSKIRDPPSSLHEELSKFNCNAFVVSRTGQVLAAVDVTRTTNTTADVSPSSISPTIALSVLQSIPALKRCVSSLRAAVSSEDNLDYVLEPVVSISLNNTLIIYVKEQNSDTIVLLQPPSQPLDTNKVFELSRQCL